MSISSLFSMKKKNATQLNYFMIKQLLAHLSDIFNKHLAFVFICGFSDGGRVMFHSCTDVLINTMPLLL